MARMNISLPDPLYERLDRLRDRVNASKVCAIALEKELDMVEGRAAPVGKSDIDRLVERLQRETDKWFERGQQDGRAWSVEVASVEDLHLIGEEWEDDGNYDLDQGDLPDSFDLWETLGKWDGHAALEEESHFHLKAAYLRGWHYAARDIWREARPRLRFVHGGA